MARFFGLMSGTSLDGVDAVSLLVDEERMRVEGHYHAPYPDTVKAEAAALIECVISGEYAPTGNPRPLSSLEAGAHFALKLARVYHQASNGLLNQIACPASAVRALGAHGQTVCHRPEAGFSIQLLNAAALAEACGIDVVCDFRARDLAAGGQGAPLVPAFHHAFFARPQRRRAVVNIGGIANITLLPGNDRGLVRGFDTGPGNTLLDTWYRRHHPDTQPEFDTDSAWAATGRPHPDLLHRLLADPYFALNGAKSSGREYFHLRWLESALATLPPLPPADVQATLLHLTVATIATAIENAAIDEVALCGGGALNPALRQALQQRLTNVTLTTTAEWGMPPMQVEAAAFAWLAMRFINCDNGNLAGVTGARGERILGALYPAGPASSLD